MNREHRRATQSCHPYGIIRPEKIRRIVRLFVCSALLGVIFSGRPNPRLRQVITKNVSLEERQEEFLRQLEARARTIAGEAFADGPDEVDFGSLLPGQIHPEAEREGKGQHKRGGQALRGAPKVQDRVGVTVVSGFLGSGKTTLMKNLLRQLVEEKKLRVGIVVNDIGPFNMDAHLLSQQQEKLFRKPPRLIKFSDGCICCTLREDLLVELKRMGASGNYDYILVESSGVSEPLPIAETFTFQDLPSTSLNLSAIPKALSPSDQQRNLMNLSSYVRLDTLVTVVDAGTFNLYMSPNMSKSSHMLLPLAKRPRMTTETQRTDGPEGVGELMVKQLEFADVVLINKIDMVNKSEVQRILEQVRALNPTAKLYATSNGMINSSTLVNASLFSFERALDYGDWLANPRNQTISEVEEYDIRVLCYERRRPFHPIKLFRLISKGLPKVLRCKGLMWICSRLDSALQYSKAGGQECSIANGGPWLVTAIEQELREEPEMVRDLVISQFNSTWGDRRQQLVLIGPGMNTSLVQQLLDDCLLSQHEMTKGVASLTSYEDPFPRFDDNLLEGPNYLAGAMLEDSNIAGGDEINPGFWGSK
mmetsp:Transcript_22139/g.34841  ORF Transcript_22139/g.34841 Transcript_22139/m.34841 type:complete len:591 (-) Transcript_22139:247-2019(-)